MLYAVVIGAQKTSTNMRIPQDRVSGISRVLCVRPREFDPYVHVVSGAPSSHLLRLPFVRRLSVGI